MRPVTPRGFRDVLPREAAERETILGRLADVFAAWGYEPVEPPALEVYETLEQAAGDLEGTAFRLFDLDGTLLALRPDMTMPVARLVAARMPDMVGPHRFRYAGEVFREHESLRGQARQFTQVGIELINAAGPVADAEVLSLAVEALAGAGLEDFSIAAGDVGVLFALAEAASSSAAWRTALLAAAHDRSLVSFDELTMSDGVAPAAGDALRRVIRLRGGADAIAECRTLAEPFGGAQVLDELATTWELLEVSGLAEQVVVDFGIVRGFDYYTGMVFEMYAPGLGMPLGAGGRYDGVMARFGAPAPAVGFALGLERLTIACADQGVAAMPVRPSVFVGGEPRAAFALASQLRGAGERVALAADMDAEALDEIARAAGAQVVMAE